MRCGDLNGGLGVRRRSGSIGPKRQTGRIPMWLLIGLGILGGVVLYWYTTPQDTPSWAREWLPNLPEYKGPLYRWRDYKGREHITDKPPRSRPYEQITYRSDANVVPAQSERSNQ